MNWTTICVLLILTIILELESVQVDYTAAFVHAPIGEKDVFVEMPKGHTIDGKVYRLKKSLYGLKQAPRNFYQHLKSTLEGIGFECLTDVDPCLFVSPKAICVVYVDDTIISAQTREDIDAVIDGLKKAGLTVEIEDDMAGFSECKLHPTKLTRL